MDPPWQVFRPYIRLSGLGLGLVFGLEAQRLRQKFLVGLEELQGPGI